MLCTEIDYLGDGLDMKILDTYNMKKIFKQVIIYCLIGMGVHVIDVASSN